MKQNKIIAVINNNGNVAKSSVANYGIFPRLKNNPEVIYCEAEAGNTIKGEIKETAHGPVKHFEANAEDFTEMIEYITLNMASHDIVIDFGSTDSALMRGLFLGIPGSTDIFDIWVVPTSPKVKQSDTLDSIDFLSLVGVPPEKIKLVFTILPTGRSPQKIFPEIFAAHAQEPNFTLDPAAVMRETQLINRIDGTGYSIQDLLDDKTDYVKKIVDAHPHRDDPEVADKIKEYTWLRHSKGMAITITTEFDKIFASITS